jgi:hypothetical protein
MGRLLTAAAWACAVAVCVLIWFVPPFAHVVVMMLGPLCTISGALLGWQARGRYDDHRGRGVALQPESDDDGMSPELRDDFTTGGA